MSATDDEWRPGRSFGRRLTRLPPPPRPEAPFFARFDQVEGVTDAERDQAWKRIKAAAKRYDIEVSESDWRDLAKGGKDRRR